jgi:hypothetical protein
MHHYVIKFVSDLRQVSGFLRVLRFPPPIKLVTMLYVIPDTLLKVSLNTNKTVLLVFNDTFNNASGITYYMVTSFIGV